MPRCRTAIPRYTKVDSARPAPDGGRAQRRVLCARILRPDPACSRSAVSVLSRGGTRRARLVLGLTRAGQGGGWGEGEGGAGAAESSSHGRVVAEEQESGRPRLHANAHSETARRRRLCVRACAVCPGVQHHSGRRDMHEAGDQRGQFFIYRVATAPSGSLPTMATGGWGRGMIHWSWGVFKQRSFVMPPLLSKPTKLHCYQNPCLVSLFRSLSCRRSGGGGCAIRTRCRRWSGGGGASPSPRAKFGSCNFVYNKVRTNCGMQQQQQLLC